jgi:acyl carrier protein
MTDAAVREKVRVFLVENFLYMRPKFVLADDDSLLRKGVLDSLGVMEVIGFVEQAWGVSVPQDDITEEHFGTVNGITSYVMRRAEEAA